MKTERTDSAPNVVLDRSRLGRGDRPAPRGSLMTTPRPGSSGLLGAPTGAGRPPGHHRPAPESELTLSFDPLRDLHMWTMWRVAVNGRIVDEARRRNQVAHANSQLFGDADHTPFGRALVKTPLHRFIRMGNGSEDIAGGMMDPHGEGGGQLATQQFVFYGVPRVVLNKKAATSLTLP